MGLGLRDLEYDHAEEGINMCFIILSILINSHYAINIHASNKLIVKTGP